MSDLPDDAPPTYTDAITSPSSSSSSTSYSSYLTTHLTSLPDLIRESHQAHLAAQAASDADLINLLTPHISSLLSSLGAIPHIPTLAFLTLVPAAAVPEAWTIADADDHLPGEIHRLVRVVDKLGKSKESSTPAEPKEVGVTERQRQFDEWGWWEDDAGMKKGKAAWWWDDEDMAIRLASYLQPQPRVDRQTVRAVVETAKEEKKASRWGLFRSAETQKPAPPVDAPSRAAKPEENVVMTVRAQETTFRKENDFGIWETTSGWAIVVRVRIRQS